jgi:hypothetical protein
MPFQVRTLQYRHLCTFLVSEQELSCYCSSLRFALRPSVPNFQRESK